MQQLGAEKVSDVKVAVLWARTNVYGGVGLEMLETSELGRLHATKVLTRRQYDALTAYQEIVRDYDRMVGARPVQSASDHDRTPSHDGGTGEEDDYVRRYRRVVDLWHRVNKAMNGCEDRRTRSAINTVAIYDIPLPSATEAIKAGADAIGDELGLEPEPRP